MDSSAKDPISLEFNKKLGSGHLIIQRTILWCVLCVNGCGHWLWGLWRLIWFRIYIYPLNRGSMETDQVLHHPSCYHNVLCDPSHSSSPTNSRPSPLLCRLDYITTHLNFILIKLEIFKSRYTHYICIIVLFPLKCMTTMI